MTQQQGWRLAGIVSLVVMLVGIWIVWGIAQDENAPHCSRDALQAKQCRPGDWITVLGLRADGEGEVTRYCDFNKKMHILGHSVVCHYVSDRPSR